MAAMANARRDNEVAEDVGRAQRWGDGGTDDCKSLIRACIGPSPAAMPRQTGFTIPTKHHCGPGFTVSYTRGL
ncbi:hypothetical protein SERLA73DRAFT_181438 [Serpula lacrymans var. lacrymans S7.3]|uniref:Uncharacterized protein n=2 Tax=Serpula lacrymans var. lacrymans TaxID=341189 RepID=F8PY31_SERL3|nr:uncharacterized protein SERLADRAFT_467582 [Serpula lacrymans var. lacrymans S7.9]EGN98794.1 hypothetical protein SERLA73DRAFT_181438 [Serpula lacrymans var. lacrymans S7.3]EGO24388.1 hypothetical protein SERLADRAFT_467582 [Serpula lacrymans var. lacrymans S7.9]